MCSLIERTSGAAALGTELACCCPELQRQKWEPRLQPTALGPDACPSRARPARPPRLRDCLDGPSPGSDHLPSALGQVVGQSHLSLWQGGRPACAWRVVTWVEPGLGVEDDFRDLPVLHRGAIVVPGRVTKGEAGLGPRGGRLMGHLAQPFGAIVRVWALGAGRKHSKVEMPPGLLGE